MAARDHPALQGTTLTTTHRTYAQRRRAGARRRTPLLPARARARPRRSASRPSTRLTGRWFVTPATDAGAGNSCLVRERSWLVAAGSHGSTRTRRYYLARDDEMPRDIARSLGIEVGAPRHHHANRISDAAVPVQLRALIQVNKARYGNGFAACAKLMPGTTVEVRWRECRRMRNIYILRT